MKKYYDTKVGKIVAKDFDSRMDMALFLYIMSNGVETIKKLSEEEINNVPDNGNNAIVKKNFEVALKKTAVKICNECSINEIMEYIRCHLNIKPQTHKITFYRDQFADTDSWKEFVVDSLRLEPEDVGDSLEVLVITSED